VFRGNDYSPKPSHYRDQSLFSLFDAETKNDERRKLAVGNGARQLTTAGYTGNGRALHVYGMAADTLDRSI
jgi:hypothetical protein